MSTRTLVQDTSEPADHIFVGLAARSYREFVHGESASHSKVRSDPPVSLGLKQSRATVTIMRSERSHYVLRGVRT